MYKTRKHMYTILHYITTYYLAVGGRVLFISLMGGYVRLNT
jgi:hypothetical protein